MNQWSNCFLIGRSYEWSYPSRMSFCVCLFLVFKLFFFSKMAMKFCMIWTYKSMPLHTFRLLCSF
ncbi:hypothetical protein DNTS_031676 [Danionella cerebrum]|uniref:Uncharacterized protein n=1 Tax=Danionella cerebrum TaxID=2873325 RepID=A0A553QZN4_9TELE|nr:hypothetical protein DNTS_031676 [Danionella translucida]